jgi:hypothetical protein
VVIVGCDQPLVAETARQLFLKENCLDRVKIVGGDFFEAIPKEGDLYTICRTLLNWDDEKAVEILNVCADSMHKDASVLIIDFVLPAKTHPHYLRTTLSDLNLLAIFNSGNRTEDEWTRLVSKSRLALKKVMISDETIPLANEPAILDFLPNVPEGDVIASAARQSIRNNKIRWIASSTRNDDNKGLESTLLSY